MATLTPSTIHLRGELVVKERNAAGAITPGHLVTLNTTNGVVVHAGAELNAYPWFAMEQDFVGKDLNRAYISGERVQIACEGRCSEVYALLPAAALAVVKPSTSVGACPSWPLMSQQSHALGVWTGVQVRQLSR